MKTIPFLAALGLIFGLTGPAFGEAIDELNMGLSKTSVFDTPTPDAYEYSDTRPGKNEWLPRAWDGIPPVPRVRSWMRGRPTASPLSLPTGPP